VTADRLLVFGNVSQPPYCNNFLPPLRAFQKAFAQRSSSPHVSPDSPQPEAQSPRSSPTRPSSRARTRRLTSSCARRRPALLGTNAPQLPEGDGARRLCALGSVRPRGLVCHRPTIRSLLHPGPADAARLRAAPDPGAALRSGDGPRLYFPSAPSPSATSSTTASGTVPGRARRRARRAPSPPRPRLRG